MEYLRLRKLSVVAAIAIYEKVKNLCSDVYRVA